MNLINKNISVALFALLLLASASASASACPFCAAVSQTFSEEFQSMDFVAIVELVALAEPPKPGEPIEEGAIRKSSFRVTTLIKGEESDEVIEVLYFGAGEKGDRFLLMGVDPPEILWSTPLPLNDRTEPYLLKLSDLPDEGTDRLAFFQDYLEDSDEMLARDAYDEFARAPYIALRDLEDRINHKQIVAWIEDTAIPPSRRRLYLTMLGVCGDEEDLPMLEEMMQSEDLALKAGLDAMVACYLTLKGEEGLVMIEELFVTNKEAEYADTYAAVMALRFHGTEGDVLDREAVVGTMRHMLDRPELADLVIPDLARWKDWSVMEKLVQLFIEAEEENTWVRVPVVNYLRACPLDEAAEQLKRLEEIDPEAVRRANTFFPFGTSTIPGRETPVPEENQSS